LNAYINKLERRWAYLDPTFQVLHSKYYDFGAYSRMSFFTENGITVPLMQEHHIGPIIFREECLFKIILGQVSLVEYYTRKKGSKMNT